jgi:Mg-chelatase subunit ChlD
MVLLSPIWLLLAIPVLATLWIWPMPSRMLRMLRFLSLALLVIAMAVPAIKLPARAGTVIVVVDRSLSMPADSDAVQKEMIELVHDAMRADDQLGIVTFGQQTAVERTPQAGALNPLMAEVGREASNLADALDTALSLVPRDAPGRLLVLSDGKWTGRHPAGVVPRAVTRSIPIDYRHEQRAAAGDLAIARLEAPGHAGPGESFIVTAWVNSPLAQEATVELRRGNYVVASGKQSLHSGLNRLTFRDRAGDAGTYAYVLHVAGVAPDPVPENNTARAMVGIEGSKPILCVTHDKKSGFARLLTAGGLKIQAALPEDCQWSLERLSSYSAVILENVAADRIGVKGMENLSAWVRETGAGLMMTGGKTSYALGGYYKSPLDPVLPVSMELRREHRKLQVAIVVALDRSGSMSMPVGHGRIKMGLADLGTAAVLDLLGPGDELGVLAVDTAPHVIADIGQVKDKKSLRDRILRIGSQGGGIYIQEALEASLEMVKRSRLGTRHIILFADASDSEQSGRYKEIVDECVKEGVSITVIGMGKPTDVDAGLLRDIAARAKGSVYFSDDVFDLPRLFAQDTMVIARSSFIDEPTAVQATAGLSTVAGKSFDIRQSVGGYNLCYLQQGANLATVTVDEYKAPVIASWQIGLGRALCYTGEADGKYAGDLARWKNVGELFTSLARWTAGQSSGLPGTMLVTQEIKNGMVSVQLHLDPERKSEPFAELPKITMLRENAGALMQVQKSNLQWTTPDTLTIETPLEGNETVLATVQVPGQNPVVLPPACLPYSPEFKPAEGETGLPTLERLAHATGGKERLNLGEIWRDIPRHPRLVDISSWFLFAGILILVVEILERRTGLLTMAIHGGRRRLIQTSREPVTPMKPRSAKVKPAGDSLPAAVDKPPSPVEPSAAPAAPPKEQVGIVDALARARRKSREKTG